MHITSRITDEATALLQHTNWSVAEIAYSLGFACRKAAGAAVPGY